MAKVVSITIRENGEVDLDIESPGTTIAFGSNSLEVVLVELLSHTDKLTVDQHKTVDTVVKKLYGGKQ